MRKTGKASQAATSIGYLYIRLGADRACFVLI
jgi:hypothetical protein